MTSLLTRDSAGMPGGVASGSDDPFHPYVELLPGALPPRHEPPSLPGGHNDTFFVSRAIPSLAFLAGSLVR
jgi:hypothetical protein